MDINSHIQVPRCILSNFANKNGTLYCYDVKEKKCYPSSARKVNTSIGYYSKETEQYLSGTIEAPLGGAVSFLKKADFSNGFVLKAKTQNALIKYLRSLLARSPQMHDMVIERSLFSRFYSKQEYNDMAVRFGIEEIIKDKMFEDYKISFLLPSGEDEYILPQCGYVKYQTKSGVFVLAPVTPHIAVFMHCGGQLQGNYAAHIKKEHCDSCNRLLMKKQCALGSGLVCATHKELLEEFMPPKNDVENSRIDQNA